MRRTTFKLTPPVIPEHSIQKQIAHTLAIEVVPAGKISREGVCWFSIDHANYAGEVPGVRIGRGIIAGVPDMLILYRGAAYFIELKTSAGILTEAQREVLPMLLCAGCRVGVARDAAEVLALLDAWSIPRKRRIELA